MGWLVVTVVCTLWFLRLMLLGVYCDASVPSRAFVLRSPLELIIMTLPGWQHFPSPSLAGSQTWVSSTTRGRRLAFGDSLNYPIQWVESKDGATWELIRGLRYSGSSLPSYPSLSLDNLLYREDFLWSAHRVGVTLVQAGFTGLSPDV